MKLRLPVVVVVPVLSVTLCALAVAMVLEGLIDAALPPRSTVFEEPPQLPAPVAPPASAEAEKPKARPAVAREVRKEPERPVPTTLRLRLYGTMVSPTPEWSLATVVPLDGGFAYSLRLGSKVEDAVVTRIERGRVLFERNGRTEVLRGGAVAAGHQGPPIQRPRGEDAAPPRQALTSNVRKDDAQSWSVPRAELEQTMSNLGALAQDVRIVPNSNGFKLVSVRPGSILERLGVKSGDLLRRVNGHTLDDPEKLLAMFHQLRTASRFDVEVERDGRAVTHTYRVQ